MLFQLMLPARTRQASAGVACAGKVMVLEALLKSIRTAEPTDKVVLVSNYTGQPFRILQGLFCCLHWLVHVSGLVPYLPASEALGVTLTRLESSLPAAGLNKMFVRLDCFEV